jgi:hypothetical protein
VNKNLNSAIPGEQETVHGYSNHETFTMISHIHNDEHWLEDAFDTIRRHNNPNKLKANFKDEIFNGRGLSDIFGKMAFDKINWFEIFDNLTEMMPREEKFTIGDYLMIVDGEGLTFDWKGRIFQHDCTYREAFARAEEICVWDCANDKVYNVNQNRFVKVVQEWRVVEQSDRWISEWREAISNDIIGVNYFQGSDLESFDALREDFFLPDLMLNEKVLVKKMPTDDAIWSVIREENISKEELIERLYLAHTQATFLFDQLIELCNGKDDTMVMELFYSHNIKTLTDLTTDEYKFDK